MPTRTPPRPRLVSKRAPEATMPERLANYRTTPGSCTCPDRRFRRRPCKHMRAINEALACLQAAGLAQAT